MPLILLGLIAGFLAFSLPEVGAAEDTIELTLKQQSQSEWLVSYQLSKPVKRLILYRPVNDQSSSRTHTWKTIGDDLEMVLQDGRDIVRRKDGQHFDDARFFVVAEYRTLALDYATFLPFSDGSVAIYMGRFLACLESCEHLPSLDRYTIPLNGQVITPEGRRSYAYVGSGSIEENDDFVLIMDPGLPDYLRASMSDLIPKLMRYFESRLEPLSTKPMLLASLDVSAPHGRDGYEGGTFDEEQLYLHFYGKSWTNADPTFLKWVPWFFAHEIFHLFDLSPTLPTNQTWVKEGAADAAAALTVTDLEAMSREAITARIEQGINYCAASIDGGSPLIEHASLGEFDSYYECGLVMYLATDTAMRRASEGKETLFTLWRDFRSAVEQGAPSDQTTMIDLIDEKAGEETAAFIRKIIFEPLEDPETVLRQGLATAGYEHQLPP